MRGNILIVEDEKPLCEMLQAGLSRRGFDIRFTTEAPDAFDQLTREPVDVVLTDLQMPGIDGISLCDRITKSCPDVPVVVMTAFGSLETAVAAIRAGAYDFVTKPFEIDALAMTLQRAVEHRNLREEVRRLRRQVVQPAAPHDFVGQSDAARRVLELIDRVGDTEASILITGESGTGKEVAARALHARSRRREGPFVAINCAAMPEALLESELFGHSKGAFTDARATRSGLFIQANGGTLFLDEVGELPLGLQPKLLRALQERKVRPVGADTETPFDVRIITATNRDLEQMVDEKRFREDLFYRLNVIHVPLPPLRTRGGDVLLLAQTFLAQLSERMGKQIVGITPAAAERLLAYSWPGNVRELQNCIERAIALAQYDQLTPEDLPEKIRAPARPAAPEPGRAPAVDLLPLEEVERRHILRVLEAMGNAKGATARVLGLDRKTLYRKLERYGVQGNGNGNGGNGNGNGNGEKA